nr:MAG: DNA pilot protein [Microvirus sp.]
MSFWDTLISGATSALNFGLGLGTQAYQRRQQEESWRREDTSVQRRVKDLQAAGLNPVLAAGQGAQSSSPIQVSTPQLSLDYQDKQRVALDMMRSRAEMANTIAQRALIDAQTVKSKEDASVAAAQRRYYNVMSDHEQQTKDYESTYYPRLRESEIENRAAATRASVLDSAIRSYDWDKAKEQGLRTDVKGGVANFFQGVDAARQNIKKLQESGVGANAAAEVRDKILRDKGGPRAPEVRPGSAK